MSTNTRPILSLNDLPVVASVSSFWGSTSDEEIEAALPAHVPVSLTLDSDDEDDGGDDDSSISDELPALAESAVEGTTVDEASAVSADSPEAAASQVDESQAGHGEGGIEGEEETQEMDALLEPTAGEEKEDSG